MMGGIFSRSQAMGRSLGMKTGAQLRATRADSGFASILIAGTAVGVGVLSFSLWPTRSYPPRGLSATVKNLPEWIKKGCGDAEYTFTGARSDGVEINASFSPTYTPKTMPDLENHNNFMADVLKGAPEIYEKLRDKVTSKGVTLAKCMKTGVDNPGHPMIKTVGLIAGDEESYQVFKELFDPVIDLRHNGYAANATHPTDLDADKLSKTRIDPTCDVNGRCQYVMTTRVRAGRSVRGFRLPPSCSFEERRVLEEIISKACLNLTMAGDYFPLSGSRSFQTKPNGMDEEKQTELRGKGNLFQEPDSTLLLSSGMARHWPDARGTYHNDAKNVFVWVNEEDHMRIISMDKGDGIRNIFKNFARTATEVEKQLNADGYEIMRNDHLGYITTCPSNLGTGLRAGAMVRLPLLSQREDFKEICHKFRLQARGGKGVDSASEGGVYDVSNADRLGKSEVDLVNTFIEGVAQFIRWEMMLEQGKNIDALVPN